MRYQAKKEELRAFAKRLQEMGFAVYVSPGAAKHHLDTYAYYTDGTQIAYCQAGEWGGIDISTVHTPNRNCGTGFVMHKGLSNPTEAQIRSGFCFAPNWAMNRDRESVKKYKDFEDYNKRQRAGSALVLWEDTTPGEA
jgi:hypothetical protein